ncbi:hypothetical protein HK102_008298 [Quaeritorhiza haematococci]|nr:hypothetical protein HK102_008298 [Quaeritorhiza haematococci]
MTIHNFSAGPAVLPRPVLERVQSELLNWNNTGCSIMELSHRSKEFTASLNQTEATLRSILNVPSNYKILFMQGGATTQFSAVVLNLLKRPDQPIDYIVTGAWSEKAVQEARNLRANVNVVTTTKGTKHNGSLPPRDTWKLSGPDAAFVYYCSNETIHGVELPDPLLKPDGNVPIVCDMSSNILTRPVDVSKFGVIYAGAQKNIGPAGVTIVIIREDLVNLRSTLSEEEKAKLLPVPIMLDYKVCADNGSMYNTPPTFGIYVDGLVFEWVRDLGGLDAMAKRSGEKSGALYEAIESVKEGSVSYRCAVKVKEYRSRTNVPFRVCVDGEPSDELEALFVKEAASKGMIELKGHRSVGGLRASLYNALGMDSVQALVAFMKEFAAKHGTN